MFLPHCFASNIDFMSENDNSSDDFIIHFHLLNSLLKHMNWSQHQSVQPSQKSNEAMNESKKKKYPTTGKFQQYLEQLKHAKTATTINTTQYNNSLYSVYWPPTSSLNYNFYSWSLLLSFATLLSCSFVYLTVCVCVCVSVWVLFFVCRTHQILLNGYQPNPIDETKQCTRKTERKNMWKTKQKWQWEMDSIVVFIFWFKYFFFAIHGLENWKKTCICKIYATIRSAYLLNVVSSSNNEYEPLRVYSWRPSWKFTEIYSFFDKFPLTIWLCLVAVVCNSNFSTWHANFF